MNICKEVARFPLRVTLEVSKLPIRGTGFMLRAMLGIADRLVFDSKIAKDIPIRGRCETGVTLFPSISNQKNGE